MTLVLATNPFGLSFLSISHATILKYVIRGDMHVGFEWSVYKDVSGLVNVVMNYDYPFSESTDVR